MRHRELDSDLQSINLNRLAPLYRDILNDMVRETGLTKRDCVRLSLVLLADRWGLDSVNLRNLKHRPKITDKVSR